jgi:beta-lactamase regulating signal transducer with metallopeptidase domain
MLSTSFGPIADHLWQSTLVVGCVAALALALKRNRAELRHALWMAASIKFLIPFAVLMAIGQQLDWRVAPSVQPQVSVVVDAVGRPFSLPEHGSSTTAGTAPVAVSLGITTEALLTVWAFGTTVCLERRRRWMTDAWSRRSHASAGASPWCRRPCRWNRACSGFGIRSSSGRAASNRR